MGSGTKVCPVCSQTVGAENFVRHMRKAHPAAAAVSDDPRIRTAVRMGAETRRDHARVANQAAAVADRAQRNQSIAIVAVAAILIGGITGGVVAWPQLEPILFPKPPESPYPECQSSVDTPGPGSSNRYAVIQTSFADRPIIIELLEDKAPATTANFIQLSEQRFYDGIFFHRVIKDFMDQSGDPNTKNSNPADDGQGGPGYSIPDEASALALKHDRPGVLSMANSGPNTGGSQFFITVKPTEWLDGKHAIFGLVRECMDTAYGINRAPTDSTDHPVTPVEMKTVRIMSRCAAMVTAPGC